MNNIPQELNTVEKNMYRALSNHPEENLELCWKRGKSKNKIYVLIGRKKTNSRNGEAKYSFETKSLPLGADISHLLQPKEKESKPAITENILLQKIEELDKAIQAMKGRKSAWQALLEEYFRK